MEKTLEQLKEELEVIQRFIKLESKSLERVLDDENASNEDISKIKNDLENFIKKKANIEKKISKLEG